MLDLLLLVAISLIDLRYHRIPNILVSSLFIALLVDQHPGMHLALCLAFTIPALILYRYCGLGAGDVKLIGVLALTSIAPNQILNFLEYFSLLSLALVFSLSLREGSLKGDIPLAPALCGAVLGIQGLTYF